MSIASKLTKLETDITSAYSAISTKGGTLPANKNTDSLATSIGTIPSGAKPEETKTVVLDMSSGDQVITPTTAGDVMTQVTVEKPSTLVAGNIKKDIDIGGVVGSLEAEPSDIIADYSGITGSIGNNAFRTDQQWYAKGATRLNVPNATSVGTYFAINNTTVKKVELPKITSIGQQAFNNCSNLEYLDCSSLTTIPDRFVSGCPKLTTLLLPWEDITTIAQYGFSNFSGTTEYNMLSLSSIGLEAFSYQSVNTYYNVPLVTSITGAWRRNNQNTGGLVSIYFPSLTSLSGAYTFYMNYQMTTLILGTSNCVLARADSFQYCNAKIYVPSADLATYKSATNWSSLASRIFGVYETADKALNETFTPTVSDPDIANSIVSWDYIPVNKATATVNSSTGETTITGVGCFIGTNKSSHILLRGLDSSDNPIYNCLINITQTEV